VLRITEASDPFEGGLIVSKWQEIDGLIHIDGDEKYIVAIEEMSKEEYKNLPEWDGF
jgi:hypothetical protein